MYQTNVAYQFFEVQPFQNDQLTCEINFSFQISFSVGNYSFIFLLLPSFNFYYKLHEIINALNHLEQNPLFSVFFLYSANIERTPFSLKLQSGNVFAHVRIFHLKTIFSTIIIIWVLKKKDQYCSKMHRFCVCNCYFLEALQSGAHILFG